MTAPRTSAPAHQAAPPARFTLDLAGADSGFKPGPIVEYRGPLGPGDMRVYRVRTRKKPRPTCVEVCEDQLEEVAPEVNGQQP